MSYFDHTISGQVKAMDAPGEALPNQEIYRRLSRAMGFDEPELYEPDRSIIDRLNRETVAALKAGELNERLTAIGFDVFTGTPEDFAKELKKSAPRGKLVQLQIGQPHTF